jgi:tRNA pseudouridine38-40 synthase
VLREQVALTVAGRTDAGVHALAQVAHLKAKKSLTPLAVEHGLNDRLPFDVNILEVEAAPSGFHARHDALSRTNLYRISRRRTAFEKRYVWWVKDRLNFTAMAAAAKLFAGRHDFSSFCENAEGQTSTDVVVEKSAMLEWEQEIHYRVEASHFLWKMVRRLVGTLVEVGRGNVDAAGVKTLLERRSGEPAKWTAPPSGLFLEKVTYPA